jgi:nicotinamidase/pyrazinamidase
VSGRALIIVDVQPTFCEDGELPVAGGDRTAQRIAEYLAQHRRDYDLIVTSQDWHVDPAEHFSEQPDYENTWPPHGLAGTDNAQLHPVLLAGLGSGADVTIKKGQHAAAYSAFDGIDSAGRPLIDVLSASTIDSIDVCGIAESHCVRATALDACIAGLAVSLLADLTVPVTEDSGAAARKAILANGGTIRFTS